MWQGQEGLRIFYFIIKEPIFDLESDEILYWDIDNLPWLKWFCGRTIPACSCDCRDRWSIADWRDGTIPRCVKGVVTLPCRLAPNNVKLGGWAWCIDCAGRDEFNDKAMDWGDIPWVNPGGTVWQPLRSTEGLLEEKRDHKRPQGKVTMFMPQPGLLLQAVTWVQEQV